MSQPSTRDYDRMIGLAAALIQAREPGDAWQLIGQELLDSLFRADVFTRVKVDYSRFDGEMLDIEPGLAAHQVPPGSPVHRTIITEHPLSVHYGVTESLTPMRGSDLMPNRSWRRTEAYAKMRELFGTTHALGVPLQAKPFRGLSIQLANRDFAERDLSVARRLQPLLIAVDRHLRYLDRWRESGSRSADAVVTDLKITPRELVVLTAMADGHSAYGIARRLNISIRTVEKHQEKLYRKLGAADRLSAVLRAQRLGILRAPGVRRE
ncbi:hypothetical protein Acor_66710 [Acrocarpospora corrugata]|uniref:HTH luxR-type domain-containing protein n=1 Tax=Acrocarpospora corrugata TaxID=35763 RepID=A0A5M3WBR5_9ACTN|nr:LuxR C-terminal-related transcriptional regulator [Acrocarpospora corrugata]GES04603.1 hypothetical protein Acor_66710 [Acrocarpospora corrugata]